MGMSLFLINIKRTAKNVSISKYFYRADGNFWKNSPVFEFQNIFFKYSNFFTEQRASSEKNSPVFEFPNIFKVKIWPGDWMIIFCPYNIKLAIFWILVLQCLIEKCLLYPTSVSVHDGIKYQCNVIILNTNKQHKDP